ncbi:MAG: hypothetical protein AMS15_07185 [Planctomycetes bacterium DG_23]|nr:MAG: hypothetical protein AMS15_07185 [Planctomycetes bacterium DG_23]
MHFSMGRGRLAEAGLKQTSFTEKFSFWLFFGCFCFGGVYNFIFIVVRGLRFDRDFCWSEFYEPSTF